VGRAFTRGGGAGATGGTGGTPAAAGTCSNTCQHANDGECDDGRANSHTNLCASGTDCADCGPVGRAFARPNAATVPAGTCTNTCRTSNDNECDDGRPNAHTSVCNLGTDCADCGPVGVPFQRGGGGGGGGGTPPAGGGEPTTDPPAAGGTGTTDTPPATP
jgi:hypothetical protein